MERWSQLTDDGNPCHYRRNLRKKLQKYNPVLSGEIPPYHPRGYLAELAGLALRPSARATGCLPNSRGIDGELCASESGNTKGEFSDST